MVSSLGPLARSLARPPANLNSNRGHFGRPGKNRYKSRGVTDWIRKDSESFYKALKFRVEGPGLLCDSSL